MKSEVLDLADQNDRTLIEKELEANIFVEAGAGSGKTHELVERICAMVDAGVELKSVAAITFTEKAAGELRERVRRQLDDASPTDLRRRALDQLDTAPIGTIHSFAARIISEHPIEAGVPPLITVVDELRSQIAFTRRWEAARQKLFTDPSIDDALRILLAVGVSLDHLQNVASGLDSNWDRLESHPPQRRHIPAVELGPLLRQTSEVLAHADHCTDPADKLLTAFEHIKSWHGRLAEAETGELGLVLELLHSVPQSGFGGGQKGNWSVNVADVRSSCKDLAEQAIALRNSFVQPAVETVTAAMAEVLLQAARERQHSGELEYHDLLIHARDLLVGEDKHAVHAALHNRYHCIMLDEFQDTDPVQAELATRIAADEVCGPEGWEQLRVPPGRLFTVGDPKQSIYRFRRADIATYLAAQERFSGDPSSSIASLQTNFRSTGALLEWINSTFGHLIVPSGTIQPEYRALAPDPQRPDWNNGHGAAVSVIGRAGAQPGQSGKVTADDMRRQEAADVAAGIRIATGTAGLPAWQKQSKRSDGFKCSPVELKDICVLIPTRTSLAALEDALDDAGIEYRAEASSLVYSTQEVTDLLLAMRAISNTADEAALVLSLRSAMFGCGDDELFEWKQAGGHWNIFSNVPETLNDSTVAHGLQYLAVLCRDTEVLTPTEIMERLVTDRRMLEAAIDAPRYRDVWRRLRFVLDQARAWTEATHGGLRDYLVWAAVQQEENSRVKEAVVPETDVQAVRIMTIHASKGLEFPMVILAGTGSGPKNQKASALWDQRAQLQVHFIGDIRSAGYGRAEAVEKEFDDAERRRLLYVACTRAESHLVVSHYVNARNSLGQILKDADAASAPDLAIPEDMPLQARAPHEVLPVEAFDAWQQRRDEWKKNSALASATSVTAIAKGAEDLAGPEPDGAPRFVGIDEDGALPSFAAPGGEHGPEFGTALHRLLELSDLREAANFDELAERIADAAGLGDPAGLAERARSALRSTPVQRAAEREHWLELPVVTSKDGVTLEGIIDLMYREDDGTLVVADFKTDISVPRERLAAYWRQLSTYAGMVERITGQKVSELVLIFCRAGDAEIRRQTRHTKAETEL
ncbi:UvrD-helicase domain-containing protein [Pseudarthrobacter sp. MDT3-26]|uniref:UvrD-helicase domain-containing protein n=1 Tax=Pseudarthrobacter raffinosi TaxID=2953651 RepID=UPI00208FCDC1|nr:UvrD-helicase domain-containing protein [Pseudarthrobacter sp. MDT3-26]MCO4261501.1 UvrD-helicase domain-containing protein [Pseudarthrobacter sp. MDT3-26]